MGNRQDEKRKSEAAKFLQMAEVSEALNEIDRKNLATTGKELYRKLSPNPAEEVLTCKSKATDDDGYVVKVNRRTREGVPMNLYREGKHGVDRVYEASQEKAEKKGASTATTKKWTTEQDDALRKAVKRYNGKNWKLIAAEVPGRTHVQCLQRWKKVIRPGLIKGHWTKEEDKLLLQLMSDNSRVGSWSDIAAKIPGRTPKQCRERWCLNLNPNINKGPWTREEDRKVMEYQQMLGNKWAEIAARLPGRTENAIKSRYKSLARAQEKLWTIQEDTTIIYCKCTYKFRWNNIQKRLPGRTKNAIKLRWKYLVSLDPFLETLDTSNVSNSEAIAQNKASELAKVAARTTPPHEATAEKLGEKSIENISSWLQLDGPVNDYSGNLTYIEPLLNFDTVYPVVARNENSNPSNQNGISLNDSRMQAPYQSPRHICRNNSLEIQTTSPIQKKSASGAPLQYWPGSMEYHDQNPDTRTIDEALKVLAGSGKSWKSDASTSGGSSNSKHGFPALNSSTSQDMKMKFEPASGSDILKATKSDEALIGEFFGSTSSSDFMNLKTEDVRIV